MSITLMSAEKSWKESNVCLSNYIRTVIACSKMTQDEFAAKMRISPKTLRRRIEKPFEMSVSEIRMLNYLAQKVGIEPMKVA